MAWDPNMINSQSVSAQKIANEIEIRRLEFDKKKFIVETRISVAAIIISIVSLGLSIFAISN